VSIHLGDGAGAFGGSTSIPAGDRPASLAVGDFNGDGKLDFATANYQSNNVSIRLGNGAGGFTIEPDVPVGQAPLSLVAGDFNGDGKPDLAVPNGLSDNVTLLLSTFPAPPAPPARGLVASLLSVQVK